MLMIDFFFLVMGNGLGPVPSIKSERGMFHISLTPSVDLALRWLHFQLDGVRWGGKYITL